MCGEEIVLGVIGVADAKSTNKFACVSFFFFGISMENTRELQTDFCITVQCFQLS